MEPHSFQPHEFVIDAEHPCLPGHFPGRPVVPGVLILQEVVNCLAQDGRVVGEVLQVKFVSPLLPEQVCRIEFGPGRGRKVKFECRSADRLVASGILGLEWAP